MSSLRAAGYAKKATATDDRGRVAGGKVAQVQIRLKLAGLIAPYRKQGRLSLRIERMPQQSRLSAGRNNGNNSWSLGLDEIEDLAFLPPEGWDQAHTLALRIIGLDGGDGETLAVLDLPISRDAPDGDEGAGISEPAALAEIRRLQAELAAFKTEASRPTAEPPAPSRHAIEAELAAARATWKAEADQRLKQVVEEAAANLERREKAWDVETNTRMQQVEEREQGRRMEARDLWKREAQQSLGEAEAAWKAAEESRFALAEKKWRQEQAALTEQLQATGRTDGEIDRLRAALARSEASVAERSAELARAKTETEQLRVASQRETQDALARSKAEGEQLRTASEREKQDALSRARSSWESEAAQTLAARLAQAEADWKAATERSVAAANAQSDATRVQGKQESDRLAAELATLRTALLDRERELKQVAANDELARNALKQAGLREEQLRSELKQADLRGEQLRNELKQASERDQQLLNELKRNAEEGLAKARSSWNAEEAARQSALDQVWRRQIDEATAGRERAERALAEATMGSVDRTTLVRLEHERATLEASLAQANARAEAAEKNLASMPSAAPDSMATKRLEDEAAALRKALANEKARADAAERSPASSPSVVADATTTKRLEDEAVALRKALADEKARADQAQKSLDNANREAEIQKALAKSFTDDRQSLQAALSETQLALDTARLLPGSAGGGTSGADHAEAIRRLEESHAASLAERDHALAEALAKAREDLAAAKEQWQTDAQAALMLAEGDWKAGEAQRVADAEALWMEQKGTALTVAVGRYETAEASLAQIRMRADAARERGDDADIRKLRAEIVQLQAAIGERDNELAYARATLDSNGIKAPMPGEGGPKQKYRTKDERERDRRMQSAGRLILEVAAAGAIALGVVYYYPRILPMLPENWQENIAVVSASLGDALGTSHEQSGSPTKVVAAAAPADQPVPATTTHFANVHAGPSSKAKSVTILKRGAEISVIRHQGNWTLIATPSGDQGWVFGSYIKFEPAPPVPPHGHAPKVLQ